MWMVSFFILGAGVAHADIRKDFVSFDKAFIPPLALTNQEKLKPSKKAMKLLKNEWTTLKTKYYDANPKDTQWKDDFDKADKVILDAEEIVKSGKNLYIAHETLEEIRILFMELRRRNNIDYYIDLLTEFHEHMEYISHAGKENTPQSLTDGDIGDIKSTLSEAQSIWAKIKDAKFDRHLYGFSDQKLTKMHKYLTLESDALFNLGNALKNHDKSLIIQTAKGIKPNYAKLYKLFGDFENLKK